MVHPSTQISAEGYRQAILAIIFNSRGEMLCGKRIGNRGSFQAPQGGIKPEEPTTDAFFREVREEIGVTRENLVLILKLPSTFKYRSPTMRKHRGQEMHVFLAAISRDGIEPSLSDQGFDEEFLSYCDVSYIEPGKTKPEFTGVSWLDWTMLINSCPAYKRDLYVNIAEAARPAIERVLEGAKKT